MADSRQRKALGDTAEAHARRFLEAQGMTFVAAQWRRPGGELDLVMVDPASECLVFVEVKARRGERAGRADDAITPTKASRLLATAEWFVAEHPEHQHRIWRIDLVAIAIDPATGRPEIRHYVNAVQTG
ncbi:MAG: YraN family protein [Thermomicrobiales bacterium]